MRDSRLEQAIDTLAQMPRQIEGVFHLVPRERWGWEPDSWEAMPGERFSAQAQVCHLRDIEIDGYHVRFRRLLEEENPDLSSLESYQLARERAYAQADPFQAIAAFRAARLATIDLLAHLDARQLERRGKFAEYGDITLRGLIHYLCSHDQQHLACMQWLLGKMASP